MSELANFNRAQMVIQAYNMQNLGKKYGIDAQGTKISNYEL